MNETLKITSKDPSWQIERKKKPGFEIVTLQPPLLTTETPQSRRFEGTTTIETENIDVTFAAMFWGKPREPELKYTCGDYGDAFVVTIPGIATVVGIRLMDFLTAAWREKWEQYAKDKTFLLKKNEAFSLKYPDVTGAAFMREHHTHYSFMDFVENSLVPGITDAVLRDYDEYQTKGVFRNRQLHHTETAISDLQIEWIFNQGKFLGFLQDKTRYNRQQFPNPSWYANGIFGQQMIVFPDKLVKPFDINNPFSRNRFPQITSQLVRSQADLYGHLINPIKFFCGNVNSLSDRMIHQLQQLGYNEEQIEQMLVEKTQSQYATFPTGFNYNVSAEKENWHSRLDIQTQRYPYDFITHDNAYSDSIFNDFGLATDGSLNISYDEADRSQDQHDLQIRYEKLMVTLQKDPRQAAIQLDTEGYVNDDRGAIYGSIKSRTQPLSTISTR